MERTTAIGKGVKSLDIWQSFLLQQDPITLIWSGIAGLVLFSVVYGLTARQYQQTDRERMRRIQASLDYYARASACLHFWVNRAPADAASRAVTEKDTAAITAAVLACKAAPYATTELMERIDQYMDQPDRQSALLLYRTLHMQISRLTRERKALLTRGEQPQWGSLFLKTLRPLLAVAALLLEGWLVLYSLQDLHNAYEAGPPMPFFVILRLISCTGALILVYGVFSADFRESGRRASFMMMTMIIAALGLIHLFGWMTAPYVLIVQILVFAAGYRFTRESKRKERPYAGEYE